MFKINYLKRQGLEVSTNGLRGYLGFTPGQVWKG
jgi:hypothetical protein